MNQSIGIKLPNDGFRNTLNTERPMLNGAKMKNPSQFSPDRRAKNNDEILTSVSNELLKNLKGFTKVSAMSKQSKMLKKTKSLPRIALR